MQSKQGSVLIYAIILVNVVVFLAFMIFSRSEILLRNANLQEYNGKLAKNIDEKMNLITQYDAYLNSNGGGFTDSRACPTVTLIPGGTFAMQLAYTGSTLFCYGPSLNLKFTANGEYLNKITYNGLNATVSIGTTSTGVFTDGTTFSFPLGAMSGIDANFDSDNYTAYSTGTIKYPDGTMDDDTLARETYYGYIRRNAGWYNVFWNNDEMTKFIANNPNNRDSFHVFMTGSTDARLYLDIDQPALLRIVQFNKATYDMTNEFKKISDKVYQFGGSGYGYVQSGSTIAGSTIINTTVGGNALNKTFGAAPLRFNLRDNNYGVFLSFSGANLGIADFLSYKLRFTDASGSGVYIVPIDDSDAGFYYFMGNDMIIDSETNFIAKQMKLTKAR